MRRAEGGKVIGAAAVIDIVSIASHRGRARRRALAVDFVSRREKRLEPSHGGDDFWIEDAVRAIRSRRLNHGEDNGDIQPLRVSEPRRFRGVDRVADIYAVACVEVGVEPLAKLERRRSIGGGARWVASLVHPIRSIAKSRVLHETRVIMMAKCFFPKIETGLLEVMEREVEILLQKRRQ